MRSTGPAGHSPLLGPGDRAVGVLRGALGELGRAMGEREDDWMGRQENVTGSTHEVDGITFTLIDRDGPRLAVVLGGQPQEVFDLKHLGQLLEEGGAT